MRFKRFSKSSLSGVEWSGESLRLMDEVSSCFRARQGGLVARKDAKPQRGEG